MLFKNLEYMYLLNDTFKHYFRQIFGYTEILTLPLVELAVETLTPFLTRPSKDYHLWHTRI